jgi:periplasmic protein TonB
MSAHSNLALSNRNETGKPPQKPVPVKTLTLVPQPGKALFADSLLEATSGQRRRQALAMIFTSALEFFLVGLIVLLPLWYPEVLPMRELVTTLTAPPPPPPAPPPPPPASAAPKAPRVSNLINGMLMAPTRIPSSILMLKEKEPEPAASSGFGVVGGVPGGTAGGVIGGILSSAPKPRVVMQSAPPPKRVIISQGVTEGMILSKTAPVYPPIARAARIEGVVMLKAIIAKDGTIQNLQVLSGHPMLAPAAVAAVQQWRYRPYLLNGEPVEVETTVQVIFVIGGQ